MESYNTSMGNTPATETITSTRHVLVCTCIAVKAIQCLNRLEQALINGDIANTELCANAVRSHVICHPWLLACPVDIFTMCDNAINGDYGNAIDSLCDARQELTDMVIRGHAMTSALVDTIRSMAEDEE